MSQPGFNPSFVNLSCLATLKSCDTTKQSVMGQTELNCVVMLDWIIWNGTVLHAKPFPHIYGEFEILNITI